MRLPRGARICIVMMSAVGDTVHVLPVVTALKRHDPSIRITWILQPGPASLVGGHPDVDEILVFDRSAGLRGFVEVGRALRERRFDLVLNLQVYLKAGLVTLLTRTPAKLGFDRGRARDLNWLVTNRKIPPHPTQHVQDQYFEFLHYLDVSPEPIEWKLGSRPEEAGRYGPLLEGIERPRIALVTGTSNPAKEWPAARYAELGDRLAAELGVETILVGGRSAREEATAEAIARASKSPPHDLRAWDLRRLVYLLENADAVVTPDTGPLHIAVALETPTVGLFGHTNPKRYGPYRRFGELVVDGYGNPGEVYEAAAGRRAGRMGRIGVDEVLEKVMLALEGYGRGSRIGQAEP